MRAIDPKDVGIGVTFLARSPTPNFIDVPRKQRDHRISQPINLTIQKEMRTYIMRRLDPQTFVAVDDDSENELIVDSYIRPRATMFRSDSDGLDSIVGRGLLNRSQAAYEQEQQTTTTTNGESMNDDDDNE